MSDDLISRKAVLERLQLLRKLNTEEAIQIAIDAVEQQISFCKAAFDKEKVMEQLDKCRVYQFQGMLPDGRVCHFSDVIEIVEKGGIE